jgi:nicotinate dehydrogenase subunit B
MLDTQVSRRTLLKSGGALVVGFALAGPLASVMGRAAMAKPTSLDEVGTFLAIDRDNFLTVYTGKTDLGTGIRIALMQMAAEELDMPIEQTRLVEGDTDLCPDQGPTWASLSVQVAGAQIRRAAATARHALLDLAADRLATSRDNLEVRDGMVRVRGGGGQITWGEQVDGQIIDLAVDDDAQVKSAAEHRLVGRSLPRPDIPAKVTGTFMFAQNVRVPGMVHARMVFPPGIGSELVSVDEDSVADIPGLLAVVRRNNFLAVVAETEWAAIRARRQLKAEWSDWEDLPDPDRLYEHVRATPVVQTDVDGEQGDADTALEDADETFSATYDFGIQMHGSIGPSCAVAQVDNGRVTVWSPSQSPYWTRNEVAQILGMDESEVHFIYAEGAGCYGRNGHEDCTAQAALIAREVGRPVRLQWMREDEHGWSPKGPPTLIDLDAGMDGNGKVTAWRVNYYIPQQTALLPIENLAAIYAGVDHDTVLNPGRIQNNAVAGYAFPNAKAVLHRLETTPFRPSWIRSPGRMQNTYAIEAFMDELAAAASADPVEFRLAHLEDERGAETLRAAVRRAGWETRPSPKPDTGGTILTGRGVAYARYETRTYVAGVADVEVDRETGKIRVLRVVIGHDCGQMVNPDGVINQIEGQVIQTVSRTLMEEVKFDRSNVTSLDWESYPIISFPDVPEVVSELIVRQDQPPWGVGEMAAIVVPPAITNAVFDATGKRLRSVPFTPEKMLAVLES